MATPALKGLMGGYFHQDWDTYGDTSRDVVEAFVADDRELADHLRGEVEATLAAVPDEASLQTLLEDLGYETYPMSADGTYRTWLSELASYTGDALMGRAG